MYAPGHADVEQVVGDLTRAMLEGDAESRGLWQVTGPAGAGKSLLLTRLQSELREHSLVPLLVTPSIHSLDAGPTALMQVAVGLKRANRINGELEAMADPHRRWSDKIDDMRRWLGEQRKDVVLLCDEPYLWVSNGSEETHALHHSQDLIRALVEAAPCRRVVAGFLPPDVRVQHRTALAPSNSGYFVEGYARGWEPLGPIAYDLLHALGARDCERTPLELDLLVASAVVVGVKAVIRWLPRKARAREIARFLADRLSERADMAGVRRAWARLALLRVAVDEEDIGRLGDLPDDGLQRFLVCRGLLAGDGSRVAMHPALQAEGRAREWLSGEELGAAHREYAGYFRARFQDGAGRQEHGAILDEMEAFHHAASAPDGTTLDTFRAFFVDQLHTLGRTLSLEVKDREGAAAVFERAVDWDPEDDYGHHYLAFNLDILGKDSRRVEENYRRAIDLNPLNVWWRSRWINYLITRGRTPEAQEAWDGATDALGLPDRHADPGVYENLHLWVARLLIHRGQIEFAERVLGEIPTDVIRAHPGLAAIRRRLRFLVEASRMRVVFPLTIPPERWWQGPHLSALRAEPGKALLRWLPGRIQGLGDDEVSLLLAEPPGEEAGGPRFLNATLSFAEFDRASRDEPAAELKAGRFVELGVYGAEETLIIRVHRADRWEDRDMPPLFPDPLRYLRNDGWVG